MTESVKTYSADGIETMPCCNCLTAGLPLWLPLNRLHKRVNKGRVMYYCDMCWQTRQKALRAIKRRARA